MEKLEELLSQVLAAQMEDREAAKRAEEAKKAAETAPEYVTVETLEATLKSFAEQIGAQVSKAIADGVAAQVEKALPLREEGAGRQGVEKGGVDADFETDPVGYLARKAMTDEGLTVEEQAVAWGITKAIMEKDLQYGAE